jgi:hypothetical protein
MDRFVASSRPTMAARKPRGMVLATDQNSSTGRLLLEMAPEAKIGIARDEHFLIYRSVHRVTGGATFSNGFVFKDKRSCLGSMAFPAGLMFGQQGGAAPCDCRSLMGVMTIATTHLAFNNRVMVRQIKLAALIQVTFEADFWRFSRIDNGIRRATALIVNATRSMARFTSDIF